MMEMILAFLATINCYPTAEIKIEGDTTYYRNGVVYIAPHMYKDHILVHELVHDCQYQKHGVAKSRREWINRERHAMHIETMYLEQQNYPR